MKKRIYLSHAKAQRRKGYCFAIFFLWIIQTSMHFKLRGIRSPEIIDSPIDMKPDFQEKTLTLTLYSLSAPCYTTVLMELIQLLNQTETIFSGTDLRLIFKIHSF